MDKVKRIQELRRSNAATAIPSKKKYKRKQKHKNKFDQLKIRPGAIRTDVRMILITLFTGILYGVSLDSVSLI